MQLELLLGTLIWFIVGVVVAVWIYLDGKKNNDVSALWVVIGFLVSILGALLYYFLVARNRRPKEEYPPKPEYGKPEYKMDKSVAAPEQQKPTQTAPAKQEKSVQQVEGAPRCQSCGAAISVHDSKCPKCGHKLKDY